MNQMVVDGVVQTAFVLGLIIFAFSGWAAFILANIRTK